MSIQAFGPRGNTFNIACNSSSSVPVRVVSSPAGCYTYHFVNEGADKCYFAWSRSPGVTVQIPVPGTPANGMPILPNEIVIYNLTPDAYFATITEAGDATNLLITAGEGM